MFRERDSKQKIISSLDRPTRLMQSGTSGNRG